MSSKNAKRFAERVLKAFRDAGHYTDEEVVDAGGPSSTTLTKLRKVADGKSDMPEPRGDTLRRIDQAAKWVDGSARSLWLYGKSPTLLVDEIDRLLDQRLGEPPTPAADLPEQSVSRRLDRMEARLEMIAARLDLGVEASDLEVIERAVRRISEANAQLRPEASHQAVGEAVTETG